MTLGSRPSSDQPSNRFSLALLLSQSLFIEAFTKSATHYKTKGAALSSSIPGCFKGRSLLDSQTLNRDDNFPDCVFGFAILEGRACPLRSSKLYDALGR